MTAPRHDVLRAHYEACLAAHGDSHLGVNWPRREDADTRHAVMLDLVAPDPAGPVTLLDFGCGASHFFEHIQARGRTDVVYAGLDISERFCALSRTKFPGNPYYCMDFLAPDVELPEFDYIVLNGVFTAKSTLTFDEMWEFCQRLLTKLYPHARRGLAFNAMSKHVDWERDELFHLPFDLMASFVRNHLTRRYTIRSDYGLYDYTVYLYR